MQTVGLLAAMFLVLAPRCGAQRPAPWPDFRGPSGDGRAVDATPPLTWSEHDNVSWKTAIHGQGWSSPVVDDGRIWLTTATPDGRELSVLAVDLASGKILHDRVVFHVAKPASKNTLNSYASPSPVVEAGRVYVHFGTYGTACLDTTNAKTLWTRRDLHCDHLQGPGSSPLLYEDLLILPVDGGDVQYIVALDTQTGKTRWKTQRSAKLAKLVPDLRKAYSTPIVIDVDDKPRVISTGAQATYGYDPSTGKELWRVRHKGFSMASRPIAGNGLVYLCTGFMHPRLLAVRTSGTGDVTESNVVWSYRRNVPTMPSPVLFEGRIYLVNDSGIASCVDARSGKRVWRHRLDGAHCASLLAAGGHIYFFDREGRTVVIQPSSKFEQLTVNELDRGFMASPAVVGDTLILRTKTHLYRIEEH